MSRGGLSSITLGRYVAGDSVVHRLDPRTKLLGYACLSGALFAVHHPAGLGIVTLFLLFLAVGIAYWQYGGGLALMPAFTADFFGPKNLGMNYGLVFIGWGLGFFMTRLAGTIKDITGTLTWAFILSAIVLIVAVVISRVTKRPMHATE